MARVTIKSLQAEIENLQSINRFYSEEINKLNKEIDDFRDKEKIVSREEYDFLVKELEHQKLMTAEYKKLYDNLRDRNSKERENLLNKIEDLQKKFDSTEIKLNARGAGRKAYSNKEVIQRIYSLYINGSSLQQIADELNRSEIKTKRGKEWSKSSIRFIILNPKNVSQEFISEDIFNRAVKLLNDNKKRLTI